MNTLFLLKKKNNYFLNYIFFNSKYKKIFILILKSVRSECQCTHKFLVIIWYF